ncbi:hypothetical protein [Polyangium aurulentum]|uniref:hypothetical protein n=1 Tax=Polyangium aurulentum TaxID=2567896 RepID=UPI00197DB681|nr:hypothetical protein [Polyangium aurulentum]UQA62428.1 hypothetical protein E8A73_019005 [Polyangium aurulentum]
MSRSAFFAISMTALALAACGGGNPEPAVAPQPEGPSASADKPAATPEEGEAPADAPAPAVAANAVKNTALQVSAGGKPARYEYALVTSEGASVLKLKMSNVPLTCEGDMPEDSNETLASFEVEVVQRLAPDGSTRWAILPPQGSEPEKEPRWVKVEGDAKKGVTVELPETKMKDADDQELIVKGRLTAKGCGVVPPDTWRQDSKSPEPTPVPQPSFKFTVAGKAQPIVSAVLIKKKGAFEELLLRTSAEGCNSKVWQADIEHSLRFDKKKQIDFGALDGTIVGDIPMSETFRADNPAPKVTLGAEAKGTVQVTLKGDYKVMDYKIQADGKLQATVCEK